MDIDIVQIKEYYENMSDEKLTHIATNDAAGMRPDAQQVIREEIIRRRLNPDLIKGLEIQNHDQTAIDIETYTEIIRSLHCPICGSDSHRLNSTMTRQVFSFIIFSTSTRRLVIACPSCLDTANNKALMLTCLFGWWGIPWGLIRSIQAIYANTTNKLTNHSDQTNQGLKDFASANIGQLETYKNDKAHLLQLISAGNR